jgi:hypothetical protein
MSSLSHQPSCWTRRALLAALLVGVLCSGLARPAEGFVTVTSLDQLRGYLGQNGVKVRLAPGTYRLDTATTPNFLDVTGSDAHYDFTGVKLEVDTALFAQFKKVGTNFVMLSGDRIVFDGLSLETIGNHPPPGGCRALSIMGRGVIVRNVSLLLAGSSPYGYGSFFGIGTGASINPQKLNGIRIGGIDDQVINCRVIMRCFGHAIFIRGGQNALIKDCYVEGALRKTDDILAEKSGPAFDLGFKQYTGPLIPAGEMTSLSEDGIRCYPDDPETGRRTRDIRVENCRVHRMRRGICLAFAAGKNVVTGCEVTESERVAYHVRSETTIRASRGDALYSQILDVSTSGAKNSDIELTVLDSRRFYGHDVLATINGSGHRVVLTAVSPEAVPAALTLALARTRGLEAGAADDSRATRIALVNRTAAPVVLAPDATANTILSDGPVTDRGTNNTVRRPAPAATEGENLPKHPSVGQKFTPDDVAWDRPVYRTLFDDESALRDWRLEGGSRMSVRNGKFVLESPPGAKTPADNTGHLVCWLTREVPADFLLEFSFRPQNRRQGLAIIFFNTRGVNGESVFDPALKPRDGTFLQYLRSDLNSYHVSYWAADRLTSHLRKNYGAHVVAVGDDLVTGAASDIFQIVRIHKRGGTVRVTVDGIVALAYEDDGRTHGPVWTHSGWIGLRQMSHTESAEYDHLSVWPLKKPAPSPR